MSFVEVSGKDGETYLLATSQIVRIDDCAGYVTVFTTAGEPIVLHEEYASLKARVQKG